MVSYSIYCGLFLFLCLHFLLGLRLTQEMLINFCSNNQTWGFIEALLFQVYFSPFVVHFL